MAINKEDKTLKIDNGEFFALSAAAPFLKVGDSVITNGDGPIKLSYFIMGYIEKIVGKVSNPKKDVEDTWEIHVKRDDNVEGRGVNNSWRVRCSPEYGLDIIIMKVLDNNVKGVMPKVLDVVKYFTGESFEIATIAQVNGRKGNEKVFATSFVESVRTVKIDEAELESLIILGSFANFKCSHSECEGFANKYLYGNGWRCDKHYNQEVASFRLEECNGCKIKGLSVNLNHDNMGTPYCSPCFSEAEGAHSPIFSYGYKPKPKFVYLPNEVSSEEKPLLFMGAEVEVEYKEDRDITPIAKDIRKEFLRDRKWFYIKHDGSLSNGMEIVTEPATLTAHENTLPWRELLKYLKQRNVDSDIYTTTGLHIHANKSYITKEEQMKLGYFLASHFSEYEAIAHRRQSTYASQIPLYNHVNSTIVSGGSRHNAINWSNEKTIEFRLFKGTIKYSRIMSALQFVHAVIHFAKQPTITSAELEDHKLAWKMFTDYAHRKKKYEFLLQDLHNLNTLKEALNQRGHLIDPDDRGVEEE